MALKWIWITYIHMRPKGKHVYKLYTLNHRGTSNVYAD